LGRGPVGRGAAGHRAVFLGRSGAGLRRGRPGPPHPRAAGAGRNGFGSDRGSWEGSRMNVPAHMLINGQWVAAADGGQIEVVNPATGEVIGAVPAATAEDVDRAARAAHDAFAGWAGAPPKERARVLREAARLARSRREELGRLLTMEQGKPLKEAIGEIDASADALEYYAEEARRIYGEIYPTDRANRRSLIIKQPVGPVAAIGPWNYPVLLLSWKVAPALAAGCTVVAKPPSVTPLAVTAFLACLQE